MEWPIYQGHMNAQLALIESKFWSIPSRYALLLAPTSTLMSIAPALINVVKRGACSAPKGVPDVQQENQIDEHKNASNQEDQNAKTRWQVQHP